MAYKTDKEKIEAHNAAKQLHEYREMITVMTKFAEEKFHKKADRFVKLYKLEHYDTKSAQDRVKVPYPFANMRQLLAEIYVKDPEPIVKPKKAPYEDPETGQFIDTIKSAQKLKQAIQYVVDHTDVKRESKRATLDFLCTGLGGSIISAQENSKLPKTERVSYKNIFFDPEVTYIYDSDIMVRKLVLPLSVVKDDERFINRDKVIANSYVQKDLTGAMYQHDQFQRVIIWDIWDRRKNKHCMLPHEADFYILEEEIPYDFEDTQKGLNKDYPFAFMVGNIVPDDPWPIGEIEPIENQVYENDKIRTMQLNHVKRFNRKYQFKKGTLDEQGKRALRNPEDGTLVEKLNDNVIDVVPDAPLSADVYDVNQVIERDIEKFGGIGPDFIARGVGQRPGTLGEAELIEQSTNTLNDMRRDAIADYFRRLYRMIAQFIMQYWTEEDVLLITGDGSQETDWLHYNPQEIRGAYDYDVDPMTFTDNSAVMRKQTMELLNVATPILQLPEEMRPRGLVLLLRKLMEIYDWKDIDEILPLPTVQPEAGTDVTDPELLATLKENDPEAFVQALQALPPEDREVLEAEIERLESMGGMKPTTPTAIGTPTSSSITGGVNQI